MLTLHKRKKSAKNVIFSTKYKDSRKKCISLHPLYKSNQHDGGIAQLVRAHDS